MKNLLLIIFSGIFSVICIAAVITGMTFYLIYIYPLIFCITVIFFVLLGIYIYINSTLEQRKINQKAEEYYRKKRAEDSSKKSKNKEDILKAHRETLESIGIAKDQIEIELKKRERKLNSG